MSVPRINPSAEYKQDELSRIQQNLANAIDTNTSTPTPQLIPAGSLQSVTLPVASSAPTSLQCPPSSGWYIVMPFAGNIVAFSASTYVGSGSPVTYYIGKNGTIVYNIPGTFPTGNQSYQFTSPVAFKVNDNVQVYARSATSAVSTNVYIFAHLAIVQAT